MIAVRTVAMSGLSAKPVVEHMCADDQAQSAKCHPEWMTFYEFFSYQKRKSDYKQQHRYVPVMVPLETMPERQNANHKSQANHEKLKGFVVDHINAKKRKTGKKQRHYGTVYGTGYRSGNS